MNKIITGLALFGSIFLFTPVAFGQSQSLSGSLSFTAQLAQTLDALRVTVESLKVQVQQLQARVASQSTGQNLTTAPAPLPVAAVQPIAPVLNVSFLPDPEKNPQFAQYTVNSFQKNVELLRLHLEAQNFDIFVNGIQIIMNNFGSGLDVQNVRVYQIGKVLLGSVSNMSSNSLVQIPFTPPLDVPNMQAGGYRDIMIVADLNTGGTGLIRLEVNGFTVAAGTQVTGLPISGRNHLWTSGVPAVPTNLTVSIPFLNAPVVFLNWQDNAVSEFGFKVEYSPVITGFPPVYKEAASLPSSSAIAPTPYNYFFVGLPATTYNFRVKTYNHYGFSSYSNVATITTP